jgi:anhydro-N-acetylmuramic acid kinase
VVDGAALGVDPEAKEALAFALLAWAHVHGIPANAPGATGAAGRRVLGSYTPGASDRQGR